MIFLYTKIIMGDDTQIKTAGNAEKILKEYDEKANKIVSQMQSLLAKTHKKIDAHKYNHVLGKLKKYL